LSDFYPLGSKRITAIELLIFLLQPVRLNYLLVIPAKAGIQFLGSVFWIPAFAGMTTNNNSPENRSIWVPI